MSDGLLGFTRRELLRKAPVAALGAAMPALPGNPNRFLDNIKNVGSGVGALKHPNRPGLVVNVHHKNLYAYMSSTPDPTKLKDMLDSVVKKLSGTPGTKDAWGRIAGSGDVVGILLDLSDPKLRTSKSMVKAVTRGLISAGVKKNDIIIWAPTARKLMSAGFKINWTSSGIRCVGADQLGYDGRKAYRLKGGNFGGVSLPMSKLVTSVCKVIINLSVLRDHPTFGCYLAIPNMVMSSLKGSSNLLKYPGGYPVLGDIASWPIMKKFVLHIIDGTSATYAGKAAAGGGTSWKPGVIMGATDPVALDRMGFAMIETKRRKSGISLIINSKRKPRYIWTAATHGAGRASVEKINEVKIKL